MDNDVNKTSLWKIVVTIISAITGLILAATPGVIELMDDTDQKAQAEAFRSSQSAQKSQEMADLSYELLKNKLEILERNIGSLQSITQILISEIQILSARPNNRRQTNNGVGLGGLGLGGGGSGGGNTGVGGSAASGEVPDVSEDKSVQVEQQQLNLPEDLEKAWAKTKME